MTVHKVGKSKYGKMSRHQQPRLYLISKMMLVTKQEPWHEQKALENEETKILNIY